jgi:hypothetical protein
MRQRRVSAVDDWTTKHSEELAARGRMAQLVSPIFSGEIWKHLACDSADGFTLHAARTVAAEDREGLEHCAAMA